MPNFDTSKKYSKSFHWYKQHNRKMYFLSSKKRKIDFSNDKEEVRKKYVIERKKKSISRATRRFESIEKAKLKEEESKEIQFLNELQKESIFSEALYLLCEHMIQKYLAQSELGKQWVLNELSIVNITNKESNNFLQKWMVAFHSYFYDLFRFNEEFLHRYKKVDQEKNDIIVFLYYCLYPETNVYFFNSLLPKWLKKYHYSVEQWGKKVATFLCECLLIGKSANARLRTLQIELRKKIQCTELEFEFVIIKDTTKIQKKRQFFEYLNSEEIENEFFLLYYEQILEKKQLNFFPFLNLLKSTSWNSKIKSFEEKEDNVNYCKEIFKKLTKEMIQQEKIQISKNDSFWIDAEKKREFLLNLIQYEKRINILLVFLLFLFSFDHEKEFSVYLCYQDTPTNFYRVHILLSKDSLPSLSLVTNFSIERWRQWSVKIFSSKSFRDYAWNFPQIINYCVKYEKKIQVLVHIFFDINIIIPLTFIIYEYYIIFQPDFYMKKNSRLEMKEWNRLRENYSEGKEMSCPI